MELEQDLIKWMVALTTTIALGVFLGLTAWSLLCVVIGFIKRFVGGGIDSNKDA